MNQSQGSSVGTERELNRGVRKEKSRRKGSEVRNSGRSSRNQVPTVEPRMLEHSLYKGEVGGSSPSPATNKKFTQFSLRWAEKVGLPECPYITRYVLTVFGYSIRVHHWHASDDQRFPHDHAWDYTSIVLRGAYYEHVPGEPTRLRAAPSIASYKAEHQHKVELIGKSCWTLLFTGRPRRNWGFYVPGRDVLLRPLRYFSRYGHHPCE